MLRGVGALLVVAAGSCFAVGAARPPDPRLLPASAAAGLGTHSSPTSRVPGFGHIGFRVVDTSGHPGPLRCALLADKQAARQQGMQGRRDLAGYDAMLFRWDGDSGAAAFINKGVPIPLSLAWFDVAGVYVGATDMPVCNNCPTYSPGVPFHLAMEVLEGGLHHLGVGQGSVLLVGGSCT
jgi:uncharacterized membrane protein (UPF0127 family)